MSTNNYVFDMIFLLVPFFRRCDVLCICFLCHRNGS